MKERFAELTKSPYLIFMNGVDHLEPQADLIPILDNLNEQLTDTKIVQSVMEKVLESNAPYAEDTVVGELRYGKEEFILAGTLSTRTDIKKLNFDAQNVIEHKIEPLYAMISLCGADIYPRNQIKHIWKKLIPNHAHDSICCCSTGNVMKHMKDRYLSISEIGEELLTRGGKFINHHIKRDVIGKGVYYLTVINTNQMEYTGVMDCVFNIAIDDADKDFKIYSPDGEEVEFSIMNKEKVVCTNISPLNLPKRTEVMNYKIQMFVENIPAFGWMNYTVKTGHGYSENDFDGNVLENEYLKVDFDGNTVNLLNKSNNIYYKDILNFEDVGDIGDSYYFKPLEADAPISATLESVEVLYSNSIKSAVRLVYKMEVPECRNENSIAENTVVNYIDVVLSLGKKEKVLSVDVKIKNKSMYHLTKAVINTNIDNTVTYASSVYDVVERDSKDVDLDIRTCYSQPNNGFVYKKNDDNGIAVYTKGIYEYDNEHNRLIKLSLLRSTDMIMADLNDPNLWGVKDNLMLGEVELTFAIYPFGVNDGSIPAMEQNINNQPIYAFDSTDIYMFYGGKDAVQDSDSKELFFEKEAYGELEFEHKSSLLSVNDNVCVTALKKAEKTNDIILRAYNPSNAKVSNVLAFDNRKIVKTNLAETVELPFDNEIGKKQILTLIING